jgi:hypothetical protein
MDPSTPPVEIKGEVGMAGYLFLVLFLFGFLYIGRQIASAMKEVKGNWSEYRCVPYVMPFASLFGYDVTDNFNFCIGQAMGEQTKEVTGPFANGIKGFTGVLGNLMNSLNNFRVMFATLLGGITKIIMEFKARIVALMARVKITAGRMKAMMYRLYGTFFAIIYIGLSAQTAIMNFGDTFIFKFIDFFCFPPEQPIELDDGTVKPICEVKLGDVLLGGPVVESTYKFFSDGQEMVKLGDVLVSSNHFVEHDGVWVQAKEHPDAVPQEPWSGGVERPLHCLSTHNHKLLMGRYTFADYDETDAGNATTQAWVDKALNGITRPATPRPDCSYEIGSPETVRVKTVNGLVSLRDIQLGDMITPTSRVVGIQVSDASETCTLPSGVKIGSGSLVWVPSKEQWVRAYSLYLTESELEGESIKTISLFVSPGAQYELEDGTIVRDAMEVYSPEMKKAYADALRKHCPGHL